MRAAAAALVLLVASNAFARAGGGHSYSGSSHSSSSHSSSSSSHSSSSHSSSFSSSHSSSSSSRSSSPGSHYSPSSSSSSGAGSTTPYTSTTSYSYRGGTYAAEPSFWGPVVPVVVFQLGPLALTMLVIGLIRRGNRVRREDEATLNTFDAFRARERRSVDAAKAAVPAGLARIRARDATFDEAKFLQLVTRMFFEVQEAWSQRDLSRARRFMSDGVLRRFTTQLALNELQNRVNVVDEVRVERLEVLSVETDRAFDTLHVSISASLRDADLPAGAPPDRVRLALASKSRTYFTELWSFVRRPAPEGGKGRLAEGKCPNCGAPVEQTATATCGYCKVVLNSGAYDWVLAEITQQSEIDFTPAAAVEGLAQLEARDPALNRQVLEDRASLVFWRYVDAKARGLPEGFRRLCSEAAWEDFAAESTLPSSAFEQAAVGTVELVAVEPAEGFDRASFKVRWSTGGADGGVPQASILGLVRKAGLKTNDALGMSTDRCPACLAPQTALDNLACEYCAAPLTEDWTFASLESPEAFQARLVAARAKPAAPGQPTGAPPDVDAGDPLLAGALVARMNMLHTPEDRRRALAAMVAVARADGVVTRAERELLNTCAVRWQVPKRTLDYLLDAPDALLDSGRPQTRLEKLALLRALVAAALVDGSIDAAELRLLEQVAAHMALPPEDLAQTRRYMERARGGADT